MKAKWAIVGLVGALTADVAYAGLASSFASASSRGWGPGTAVATAEYEGDGIGFTRTDTRTGRVNFAQGIAVGFDEDGLSLSTSYALAPRFGSAVGSTLNLAIGTDGTVSHSVGRVVAGGDRERSVEAGGSADTGRREHAATASATVAGRTGPHGYVVSKTHSESNRPAAVRVNYRRVLLTR